MPWALDPGNRSPAVPTGPGRSASAAVGPAASPAGAGHGASQRPSRQRPGTVGKEGGGHGGACVRQSGERGRRSGSLNWDHKRLQRSWPANTGHEPASAPGVRPQRESRTEAFPEPWLQSGGCRQSSRDVARGSEDLHPRFPQRPRDSRRCPPHPSGTGPTGHR